MADNTTLNTGTGGDVIRSEDRSGVKTQVVAIDLNPAGSESLMAGVMPVSSFENVSYKCNTGPITGATATGTKSLAYLWHPSSITGLSYELIRVNVNFLAGSGGSQRIELRRITAENGTPGGSTGTILPKNPADAASGATVRIAPTGAPTRQSGVYQGAGVPVASNGNFFVPPFSAVAANQAKEFTMRASNAEGFEIVQEVVTTITTAPVFNIDFEWVEL